MRGNGRADDELRQVRLTRRYTVHAEGSVLVEFGLTRVLCNVSVESSVPSFFSGRITRIVPTLRSVTISSR